MTIIAGAPLGIEQFADRPGDTIEGTPLEAVYQEYIQTGYGASRCPRSRDPMMQAMNVIGYDAMVVGNHELNFGLRI